MVTKLDPPTNWAVRGIDGPIRARVDVDVQPLERARSRVTIDVDFEGHGIGKALIPLVVRRQAAKEMPETSNVSGIGSRLSQSNRVKNAGPGRPGTADRTFGIRSSACPTDHVHNPAER